MTLSQIIIVCILTSIIVYMIADFICFIKNSEEYERDEWKHR